MTNELSAQDMEFVKEVAITGNKTQSAKKAYGITDDNYANVKAQRLIRKDTINTALEEVKRSLAERVDLDKLEKVFNEGLEAYKTIKVGEDGQETIEPDFAVRHKYFDSGAKLIGAYAPEKSINLNVEANITDPKARELAEKYEEELKKSL